MATTRTIHGIGTVTDHGGGVYSVKNPKTYSTHNRAKVYGFCREPSPITMHDGKTRWIALPFWRPDGGVNLYREV